jgi:mRNA interferase MazF
MKNFDSWNKIKKRTDLRKNKLTIDEGDIRWCRIGLNIGDETLGKGETFNRPILIIKKFSQNTFWGIPITKKNKKGSWYFYIKKINRTVILNQMKLLDRKRLEGRLFDDSTISKMELDKIKDKIYFLLKS